MLDFESDLTSGSEIGVTITSLDPVISGTGQVEIGRLTNRERATGAVQLPLPEELKWSTELDWSPEDRSLVQNFLSTFEESKRNFEADRTKAIGNILKRAQGVALGPLGGDAVLRNQGFAVDPLKEIFFNGVANRVFSFAWKLNPKNSQESDRIISSINYLKRASHPEKENFGLFKLPNHFEIRFSEELKLPRIKNVVCTNITSDYAAEGIQRFQKDGSPSFMMLSMTFIELEVPTARDWS